MSNISHNREPSRSVPLPSSHIHRTHSELKLTEDTKEAEWRDYQMYRRLAKSKAQSSVDRLGYFEPSVLLKLEQMHNAQIDQNMENMVIVEDDTSYDGSTLEGCTSTTIERYQDSSPGEEEDDIFDMEL